MGLISAVYDFFGVRNNDNTVTFHDTKYFGFGQDDDRDKFDPNKKDYGISDGYASNIDVFAIVNRIKEKAIDIPLKLYTWQGDEKVLVEDGEVFDFFNKPNNRESLKQFNEWALLYYLTTGNTIIQKSYEFGVAGRVDGLNHLYYPNIDIETQIEEDSKCIIAKNYRYTIKNKEWKTIDPEEVIHVRYANPTLYGIENFMGLSPLQAGFLSVVASNNLNVADASILKNKGASGVFSNESDIFLQPEQRKRAQEALDKLLAGPKKFGKIVQSPVKTKFTQLGMSPADLKILDSRVMKKRDLCTLYNADSSLFNDPANKTYNNRKEAQKAFYTDAILPVVEKCLIDGIWNPVLKTYGDYWVEYCTENITELQEDQNKRAQKAKAISETIVKTLVAELSDDQKVQTLVHSLGITENEASKIVIG